LVDTIEDINFQKTGGEEQYFKIETLLDN